MALVLALSLAPAIALSSAQVPALTLAPALALVLALPWDHKRYQVRVIANRYSGVIAYSGFAITL